MKDRLIMIREEVIELSCNIADKLMQMYYQEEYDSDNKSDEDQAEFDSIYDIVFAELASFNEK